MTCVPINDFIDAMRRVDDAERIEPDLEVETKEYVRIKGESQIASDGLVACAMCGQSVRDLGGHYSVHFPSPTAARPCPLSYPVAKKPAKQPTETA